MTPESDDERVDRLVEVLEASEQSRASTWNEQLVREYIEHPTETKAAASLCATCPAPCEQDELCATVLVRETDLLEEVGRDQAFWLIEAAMERLEITNEARVREGDDDTRPNVFVSKRNNQ